MLRFVLPSARADGELFAGVAKVNATASRNPEPAGPRAELMLLCRRLGQLASHGPRQVADLAAWLADHPEDLAFHSVRGLARQAGTNANTVIRLVRALGYPSYDAARAAAQEAVRRAAGIEAVATPAAERHLARHHAAEAALAELFEPHRAAQVTECARLFLDARRVTALGVRSCYALSHYFTYAAAMGHANIFPAPAQPGLMMDHLAASGPEDAVLVITYAYYSTEIIRATEVARARGARIVAITDSHASPVAAGAEQLFVLPISSREHQPVLGPAMHLIDWLLEEMLRLNPEAPARVAAFEQRLLDAGAYDPRVPR